MPATNTSSTLIQKAQAKLYDAGGAVFNMENRRYGLDPTGAEEMDDNITLALQDVAAAGGGKIVFPPGSTVLIDSVNLNALAGAPCVIEGYGCTFEKAGTTAYHMYYDVSGQSDRLRFFGGRYDLNETNFTAGETVSVAFLVRHDDLIVRDLYIYNGIEEGFKMYGQVDAFFVNNRIENVRNNGLQFHNPSVDGFSGTKAKRDSRDLFVIGNWFREIDDDAAGALDGQGVTFNTTDPTYITRDVVVHGNNFSNCVRGIWTEFNTSGLPGRNFRFTDNYITESISHGIGMVGIEGITCQGNVLYNIGDASSVSSERAALILSGSSGVELKDFNVSGNTINDDRGGSAQMQYGAVIKQCARGIFKDNQITGATTSRLSVSETTVDWDTVEIVDKPVPIVSVRAPSASMTHATEETIRWTATDDIDSGDTSGSLTGLHDHTAGDPGDKRLIPQYSGIYQAGANVVAGYNGSAGTGWLRLRIYLSNAGGTVAGPWEATINLSEDSDIDYSACVVTPPIFVDVGDGQFFQVTTRQDNAGATNLTRSSTKTSAWMKQIIGSKG